MYVKLFGQIILTRPRIGQKAQYCSKVVVFIFKKPGSVLHLGHSNATQPHRLTDMKELETKRRGGESLCQFLGTCTIF